MSTNRLALLALFGAVGAAGVTARAESPPPPAAPASRPATAPGAASGRLPGEDEKGRLKWDDVCQVRLVGGKVVFSTGLTSELLVQAGITRPTTKDVQMEGLTGRTSLTIGPQMFLVRNLREHDGLTIQSSILALPGQLTIAAATSGAKDRIVELYQAGPETTGRGVPAGQLKLTIFGDELPEGQVGYIAPDFQTLWRQHPREANQDLRPLLHHLGFRLMEVDPETARQALGIRPAGAGQGDGADLAAEVDRLVAQLRAPAHKDREAAAARLATLGAPAAAVLRKLDRGKLSPEQNRAIDTLLARPGDAPAAGAAGRPRLAGTRPATGPTTAAASVNDPARLADDRHFLLDCLYDDDPAIGKAAAERLAKLTGRAEIAQQFPPDPHGPWESRAAAIERLRDELDPPPKPPPQEDEKPDADKKAGAGEKPGSAQAKPQPA
jgi:hypothetical protein